MTVSGFGHGGLLVVIIADVVTRCPRNRFLLGNERKLMASHHLSIGNWVWSGIGYFLFGGHVGIVTENCEGVGTWHGVKRQTSKGSKRNPNEG